jgi:hypothetical protein
MSQDKKVLFIGNSYTNYNNLPQLTYEVANSTGDGLIVDGSIVGGSSLEFHATNGFTENNISEDTWDYVIIQAGSIEGALTGDYFDTNVAPYAEQLVDIIKTNYACSQPVFYRTWGRENGVGGSLCVTYPWICTYEGMDDALEINYRALADTNDGLIGPVGTVWRYLIDNPNTPDLYDADESHPALAGSYVAACTFYTILLRKDPTFITYDAGLDPIVAAQIRTATKVVVYDQLAYWKVGEFDPQANFTYFENNGEVAFTNISLNADTYAWDFGDTNTSTDENPIHTYTQIGDYNVELEVTKCGVIHTYNATVSVSSLDLEDNFLKSLKLYPNPTQHLIKIDGIALETIQKITLYNLLGTSLPAKFNKSESSIDVSTLASGNYFLEIINIDGAKTIRKIIKQ